MTFRQLVLCVLVKVKIRYNSNVNELNDQIHPSLNDTGEIFDLPAIESQFLIRQLKHTHGLKIPTPSTHSNELSSAPVETLNLPESFRLKRASSAKSADTKPPLSRPFTLHRAEPKRMNGLGMSIRLNDADNQTDSKNEFETPKQKRGIGLSVPALNIPKHIPPLLSISAESSAVSTARRRNLTFSPTRPQPRINDTEPTQIKLKVDTDELRRIEQLEQLAAEQEKAGKEKMGKENQKKKKNQANEEAMENLSTDYFNYYLRIKLEEEAEIIDEVNKQVDIYAQSIAIDR